MIKEKNSKSRVWIVMMVLSLLFLLWTVPLLLLSGGRVIVEQGLVYANSSFNLDSLDQNALGFFNMSMLKPLWEELWIGFMGIYLAVELRKRKPYAWMLGLFWGIMLIVNATIQGIYEAATLNWSSACLQTYLFLALGIVAATSLMIARKNYYRSPMGG